MEKNTIQKMKTEQLKVTWKIIRKKGYRTPETYCSYIAENKNRKHKLRTNCDTKLFDLLANNVISARGDTEIHLDGVYRDDKLIFVNNFRKVK